MDFPPHPFNLLKQADIPFITDVRLLVTQHWGYGICKFHMNTWRFLTCYPHKFQTYHHSLVEREPLLLLCAWLPSCWVLDLEEWRRNARNHQLKCLALWIRLLGKTDKPHLQDFPGNIPIATEQQQQPNRTPKNHYRMQHHHVFDQAKSNCTVVQDLYWTSSNHLPILKQEVYKVSSTQGQAKLSNAVYLLTTGRLQGDGKQVTALLNTVFFGYTFTFFKHKRLNRYEGLAQFTILKGIRNILLIKF